MEWIKTSDRMPILETDDFKDYHTVDVIIFDNIGVMAAECAAGRNPKFWVEFHVEGFNGPRNGVTHWMPLPEPPKKNEPEEKWPPLTDTEFWYMKERMEGIE